MITLTINGKIRSVDAAPDTPLLWVLRDKLGMTGTKFGCGIAQCGACTVHMDGEAMRSCITPVSAVAGKKITTIEAVGANDGRQGGAEGWLEVDVPQCGYCQSGQIMSAIGAARAEQEPYRCRYRRGHVGQYLPLRHLQPDPRRNP